MTGPPFHDEHGSAIMGRFRAHLERAGFPITDETTVAEIREMLRGHHDPRLRALGEAEPALGELEELLDELDSSPTPGVQRRPPPRIEPSP